MDSGRLGFFEILTCNNILTDYYAINQCGHVFNLERRQFLKPHPDKNGYLHLMLCTNDVLSNGNHKRVDFRVATLVAKTFIGEPPNTMNDPTVDHIDGDIHNNYYKNLRWIERGVNSSIRFNRGVGESNHEAKLSSQEVVEICERICLGKPLIDIANEYGVHLSTISNIKRRKNWKHISKNYVWSF